MDVTPSVIPSINIRAGAAICVGVPVTFTATSAFGGTTPVYQWKVNGLNTGTNSTVFTTNRLVNGDVISCVMTSNAVCAVSNTISSNNIIAAVNAALCPLAFYMPNAFTPNGDGKNDECKPTLYGTVLKYTFSVYNRWGQKIFETTDMQKGWDGKVSGVDAGSTVFTWVSSFQFEGFAVETRRGTVLLIR
jgi:gliding motility-associated-like protein